MELRSWERGGWGVRSQTPLLSDRTPWLRGCPRVQSVPDGARRAFQRLFLQRVGSRYGARDNQENLNSGEDRTFCLCKARVFLLCQSGHGWSHGKLNVRGSCLSLIGPERPIAQRVFLSEPFMPGNGAEWGAAGSGTGLRAATRGAGVRRAAPLLQPSRIRLATVFIAILSAVTKNIQSIVFGKWESQSEVLVKNRWETWQTA